jgi:hypothetical protein
LVESGDVEPVFRRADCIHVAWNMVLQYFHLQSPLSLNFFVLAIYLVKKVVDFFFVEIFTFWSLLIEFP